MPTTPTTSARYSGANSRRSASSGATGVSVTERIIQGELDFRSSRYYTWVMTSLSDVSVASRVAGDDEGVGLDELALAARNHGLPLELLRHDLTPLGAHYLLTHYDIPYVDPRTFRLELGGAVDHPVTLTLDELKARPTVTVPVTVECAGNGRARLQPRPVSQPWLHEAVGTMAWTGTPLGPLLREAGVAPDGVDVVFTGADHGIERGEEQDYARSLPLPLALGGDVLLVWAANGADLPPQHGAPLRLVVPGWYGMASVKWLQRIKVVTTPFQGFQQSVAYRYQHNADDAGTPVSRIRVRSLMVPPGIPDFFTRRRYLPRGPVMLQGR